MSKYHSTISRRDFLKILGLGGVGLGAAAVSAPVIHDLDELMASPQADFKRPWWVKEVDKPTVDIDWNMMPRFDASETVFARGMVKALGEKKVMWLMKLGAANRARWMKENKPGFTHRDWALRHSDYWGLQSFLGELPPPVHPAPRTPEELGVPRWEGTPEENAKMVRAYLKLHGASEVSFVELDTSTTENMIYACDWTGAPYDILDVDEPSEEEINGVTHRVIPKKARWVIVYTIRMADVLVHRPPSYISDRAALYSYQLQTMVQCWLQSFLRILGYMCLGWHHIRGSLGTTTGFGVMGGLGEMCRAMHLITPEHGFQERVFHAITDLPLAPGKPVDFGVVKFCRTCKKCADFCPPQAIPHDTDPSWKIPGPYHHPGVRAWYRDEPRCNTYLAETSTVCGICLAVCPFSKLYKSAYHDVVRTISSTTPVFNRFFRKMDDFLGYGLMSGENIEKFWELDLPPFGWE